MFFHPLWRGGQSEPSPGGVTQAGTSSLLRHDVTAVTELGLNTVLQVPSTTRVTQGMAAGMVYRRRVRVTQVAAMVILTPPVVVPPDPADPCLTAPPVLSSNVCSQPNMTTLAPRCDCED